MTDFLDQKRTEIQARLKELKPLVDEYRRLEVAERALAGVGDGAVASPRVARRRVSAASTGRPGRPRGSGTRAQQALELVRARPGVTIPELADAMGIKQNYLYRVMPDLAGQRLVVKSGRGWHPATTPRRPRSSSAPDHPACTVPGRSSASSRPLVAGWPPCRPAAGQHSAAGRHLLA